MQTRLHWVDVSKGIAFLMVIYSHLEYRNDFLMHFFTPIFLTTFFFVSGYLFKENAGFKSVFEQRTRTLLLPLLILGMIIIALSQFVTYNEPEPFHRIKALLCQTGRNDLWFIAALYVHSLLFYWLMHWSKTAQRLLVVSLLLFVANVAYSIWLDGFQMPWHITKAGFGCFYMGLGKVYKQYERQIDAAMSKKVLSVVVVSYILVLCFYDVPISYGGSRYVIDSLLFTSAGLLICVYVSKLVLHSNRLLLFTGANTLFYFAFHGKVYSFLQTVIARCLTVSGIGHTFISDFGLGILITFADALILIPFAMLVNKYGPQILGKGFKIY